MLEARRVTKPLGDEILKELVSPRTHLRESYPLGGRVFVGFSAAHDIRFRSLASRFSGVALAGTKRLGEFETPSDVGPSLVMLMQLSEGIDTNGRCQLLVEPGDYFARATIHYEVRRGPNLRWTWPSSEPWPWKLLPKQTSVAPNVTNHEMPIYSCKFEFPIAFHISTLSEVKPLPHNSAEELTKKMTEAFSLYSGPAHSYPDQTARESGVGTVAKKRKGPDQLLEKAVSLKYSSIPADIGLRAKYRDANGVEYISKKFRLAVRAGESGLVFPADYSDIFYAVPAGQHHGSLVLFSSDDVAYDNPLISCVWAGELSFPLDIASGD
jgi:hypothetical protein